MRLLIAIPVFNEQKYLAGVLAEIRRYRHDVLVVDDGSTDGSEKILAHMAESRLIDVVRHPANLGYGKSLIDAFQFADERGYDWVLTMDCDEQHEPAMIPVFVNEIEKDDADIISGSRYLKHINGDDAPPADRLHINQIMTQRINERFHLGLTDSFCGFKAHRVSAMRRIPLDAAGYAFPMQRSGLAVPPRDCESVRSPCR